MIVIFDPAEFRAGNPKLTPEKVGDEQLQYFWEMAVTFINNTDSSPFPYDPAKGIRTRKIMLYLLVCHLATMSLWGDGQSGPLTSATEGSVSVGFQQVMMGNQAWFSQTPCGRTLLMMLRPYALGGRLAAAPTFHPYG